jgi:hypothetical protein
MSQAAAPPRDVISRDAERLEALDDLPIEGALGVERAPGEGVDAHQRVAIGLCLAGGQANRCGS